MKLFDNHFMRMALREAEKAAADGEVPLGCVIVVPKVIEPAHDGHKAVYDSDPTQATILGRAHNQTEGLSDATAHAEMMAMSSAFAAVGDWRLTGARLYVTKEPCPMCAGGIVLARLETVVWGVSDPKRGGGTTFGIFDHPGINHHPEIVAGVLEEESKAILQEFFREKRRKQSRAIESNREQSKAIESNRKQSIESNRSQSRAIDRPQSRAIESNREQSRAIDRPQSRAIESNREQSKQ